MDEIKHILDKLSKSERKTLAKALGLEETKVKLIVSPTHTQTRIPIPLINEKLTKELLTRIERVTVDHILEVIDFKGFFHFVLSDCSDVYYKRRQNGKVYCTVGNFGC